MIRPSLTWRYHEDVHAIGSLNDFRDYSDLICLFISWLYKTKTSLLKLINGWLPSFWRVWLINEKVEKIFVGVNFLDFFYLVDEVVGKDWHCW